MNVKRYRNANEDGLWRWCLFDLDWAFNTDTNSIARWLNPGGMGAGGKTDNTLFIACMKDPRFRDEFLTYFGQQLSTTFSSASIYDRVMERHAVLEPELPLHCYHWSDVYSVNTYTREVKEFLAYGVARPAKLLEYFQMALDLTDEEMQRYFGDAIRAIEEYEISSAQ